ncbi:MAG: PD-(D/E)XK nuclease family protein [Deltaproteobacteria bacterium]
MSDLVVVPTPLRKSRAERRLCDAQGGLLLGPRVATLPHLVPGLLAAAGDRRLLLTPLAERLLALAVARDAGLLGATPATGSSGGAGRAAARLLSELRSAEVTLADLRGAASGAPPRVGARLLAAASALDGYQDRLDGRDALDAAGALRAAATAAQRGARSEETADLGLLVLEGHLPASRAALDLGVAIASRARGVLARTPFLPDDPARSTPAEAWLRRIEALHELSVGRDIQVRFPSTGAQPRGRVVRLPAASDDAQCDGAARFAVSLLEDGFAAPDVAVIAPRRLLELLPAAFARLGVPLAVPLSRSLGGLPVVRDLRAALRAAGALDRTALLSLLGSPYMGPAEPIPELRLHLDRAGVLDGRGDPEERLRARAATIAGSDRAGGERGRLLRIAGATAALRRELAPLRGPATAAAWVARTRSFLEQVGVRRRAGRAEAAIARRDLAAVARFEEVQDDLAASLAMAGHADDRLPLEDWANLLDLAIDRAELPAGSGPAEGAVEAWPVEEAPGLGARATIVLGAERGSWPGTIRVDPILGNAAREALQSHLARRALPTAFHQQAEAEFRGAWALASGSEVLAVGWTRGEQGEGPAPLAAQLLDLAGAPELPLGEDPVLEDARGEGEALRSAARIVARGGPEQVEGALATLPDLARRVADAGARGLQERERRDSWLSGTASPHAGAIPAGLEAWREALPAEWSPTDLERHATCPFRYLLHASGLREEGSADLDMDRRDEGALLHAVLEAFVRVRRDRGDWPPRDDAADREEARRVASAELEKFERNGSVGDPATWAARREAVLRRIDRFVASESRGDPGLRPVLLEFGFGRDTGRPPLAIPTEDGEVLLQGRIDRVDADGRRLLVVDYKNSRSMQPSRERLSAEALGTTSFQAPVYLLAASRELPGREELAATFSLLRSGERASPWTTTPGDPFLALDLARRAEVRAEGGKTLADGVVAAVGRIRAGSLPVLSTDCTGCPFGAVCRFPRAGEA